MSICGRGLWVMMKTATARLLRKLNRNGTFHINKMHVRAVFGCLRLEWCGGKWFRAAIPIWIPVGAPKTSCYARWFIGRATDLWCRCAICVETCSSDYHRTRRRRCETFEKPLEIVKNRNSIVCAPHDNINWVRLGRWLGQVVWSGLVFYGLCGVQRSWMCERYARIEKMWINAITCVWIHHYLETSGHTFSHLTSLVRVLTHS